MVGALLGFLWYNAHPAQVIMGDTGSLALGAALATAAFMTGQWLLLPVVGFVFVAEAISVILQVGYFKLTGGRRFFKMSADPPPLRADRLVGDAGDDALLAGRHDGRPVRRGPGAAVTRKA